MAESMQRTIIDDFERVVNQLISEAAAYVSSGQSDEETDGNIRRLRVLSNALNAALQSTSFMPPRPMPTPEPPQPPEMTSAPPAAPRPAAPPTTPPPRR